MYVRTGICGNHRRMRTLRSIWWHLREELKELFFIVIGSLPLEVGKRIRSFFMRFYLAELGRNSFFYTGVRIANPESVSIGSNSTFAVRLFITGGGGVQIGDWVGCGPDVKIWSVNHRYDDPDRPWQLQGWDKKPVVIEDDVWLGANVFVMPGVRIGTGAVVSAGTVVARSVPPFAIVAGNPGRVVGWRKMPKQLADRIERATRSPTPAPPCTTGTP